MEDMKVLERVRNGDADAFAEIVERYQAQISSYLYRMIGDYEATKDLAQDTFVKAYKGVLKTDFNYSFKAWLYKIATNNVIQHSRRRKLISFIPFSKLSEHGYLLDTTPDKTENKLIVRHILSKISPDQRICLILHFVEGFKYREIAGILGITKDAVGKRIARGSKRFQILYGGG